MTKSRKLGFVDKFMAHNVNMSSPDTSAKWDNLTTTINRVKPVILDTYGDTPLTNSMLQIVGRDHVPDKLFEFSKHLLTLVESNQDVVKNDENISSIITKYAAVAESSYDKRVIDLANDIVGKVISIKKKK